MKQKQKSKIHFYLTVTVLISVNFTYWTFCKIEKYIEWVTFTSFIISISVIGGLLSVLLFNNIFPSLKKHKSNKGVKFSHHITALCWVYFPIFLIVLNENIKTTKETKTYKIEKTGESGGGPKNKSQQHYIFISTNNTKTTRMPVSPSYYKEHQNKGSVKLKIITGLFGFKYFM